MKNSNDYTIPNKIRELKYAFNIASHKRNYTIPNKIRELKS